MAFDFEIETVSKEEAETLGTGRGRSRTSKWQKLYETVEQLIRDLPKEKTESRLLKVTLEDAKESASALSSLRYYLSTNHTDWRVTASRRGSVLYFRLLRDGVEDAAEEAEL